MEGIMMRGPEGTAMSLRLPDGSIETQMKDFVSVRKKYKFLNIPIVRGVVSFIESMIFGYGCLMESAEKTSMDDMTAGEGDSKLDRWISDHFGKKMMAAIGVISLVLSFALAFLLFMYAPAKLFSLVNDKLFDGSLKNFRALFEGVIRIIIFVIYMVVVSKMKEIHRVYMYHGAEHKSIFCFEAGLELTVENVRKQKRFHPRCGTSFIFLSLIISILISSLFAIVLPKDITGVTWKWMLIKLLILPVILGVGFEFIQLAGKYPNKCTRILSAPGLWMQRITTAEPTDDIIEVGIAALKAALNGVPEEEETPEEQPGGEPEEQSEAEAETQSAENPEEAPQPDAQD